MSLNFIHIPKTAGTSLENYLISNDITFNYFHLIKQHNPSDSADKFITIIRNPFTRFVSAFNYYHTLVSQNLDNISYHNLNIDNCLSPYFTKKKMETDSYFESWIDDGILSFKTANELAEALTSDNPDIKSFAHFLCDYKHFAGLDFYLDADFVEKYHDNIIWIGKQETLDDDMIRLANLLNIQNPIPIKKIRENKNAMSKHLSDKAIQNLRNFYHKDFDSLQLLVEYDLIEEEIFISYSKYLE